MKKIVSALVLLTLFALPAVGLADSGEITPPTLDFWDALDTIVTYLFGLLIILAVIFLVIAGIMFITAQGDTEKIKKARDYVLWALIGVIVGVLAYALVNFVSQMVGHTDVI
jgi:prolipoprotein diacylglyceryltransferase